MTTFVYTIIFVACITQLTYLTNGECNDGEVQRYAYCSSTEYDFGSVQSCRVEGITGRTIITSFTLDQQNKSEVCMSGDTYGKFGTDRVWVRNGCAAVFIVCGGTCDNLHSFNDIHSNRNGKY